MIPFEAFKLRIEILRAEMDVAARACGRDPASVALLPVTKTHPATAADYVRRAGLFAVGENRVQEAIEKQTQTTAPLRWELIGHLQSNKAKLAAHHFSRIQTVDSEKLLNALDRAAAEVGKPLAVLLQINAGRDPAKFGAEIEDAAALLEAALKQKNLRVEGLMTIAPLSDDVAVAERTFTTLRELRDKLSAQFSVALPELSMGMSGDFAIAIRAGSTQIRVGTRLFGERDAQ
jgi:hypothetical protein